MQRGLAALLHLSFVGGIADVVVVDAGKGGTLVRN